MTERNWKIETGNLGQEIRIEGRTILLDSWGIPITRHSGAGTLEFTFEDMYKNSELYNRILSIFGEAVALELLALVEKGR